MAQTFAAVRIIAVMFTFSFGSAFAVTPAVPNDNTKVSEQDVRDAINAAADAAIAAENAALAAYINTVMGTSTATEKALSVDSNAITVTRTALTAATKAEKTDDAIAAIEAKRTEKLLAVNAEIRACEDYTGWFTTDTSNAAGYHAAGYAVINASLSNYDLADTYGTTTVYGTFPSTGNAYTDAVAKAVFEEKVAKMEKVVADVNPESYSKEYKGTEKSNYDKVVEAIADANMVISTAKAAVNAAADNAVWGVVKTQLGNFETAIYKAGVGEGDPTGTFVTTIAAIPKVADEPTEAAKLEWAKSLVLGTVTSQINDYQSAVLTEQNNIIVAEQLKSAPKAKVIADAKAVIADTKEACAAALEIVTYLVNDAEDWTDLVAFYVAGTANTVNVTDTKAGFTPTAKAPVTFAVGDTYYYFADKFNFAGNVGAKTFTLTVPAEKHNTTVGRYPTYVANTEVANYSEKTVVGIVEAVADLKDDAELLKATVQIDGAEYVAIEDALEDAIWAAYYGDATASLAGFTPVSALYNRQEALISSADKVVIAGKKYNSVDKWAKLDDSVNGVYSNGTAYKHDGTIEKKNYDAVRAILTETKTNIRAAATIADAEAAFVAGYDKLDAVLTMQDKATETSKPAYQTALTKAKKDIKEYVDYKAALLKASDYSYDKDTLAKNLQDKLEACYNAEELEKALADAKATVDALKTKAELTAEKNALEAEIAKIPTTVTVADKELVGTLTDKVEDFGDYVALIDSSIAVTTTAKVDAAYNTIKGLEKRAIQDALNEIGTVTLEDATAIADLTKVVDEYVAYYAGKNADQDDINALYAELTGDKGAANNKTIADLSAKLREAQIKEFRAMVAKLPADGSDVAGLKAAREFYDALSRTAKYGANGAYYTSEYDKMVDLEKVVTGDAKAYVQDLKITARSTKTSKGVKVTIKADVQPLLDAGYTVEYKFYRSTKSNKNFGTAKVTKTENTYLNTSGKKGTKYYYKAKLVVKNAEGEVVATTPLTQCLYATRTF